MIKEVHPVAKKLAISYRPADGENVLDVVIAFQ